MTRNSSPATTAKKFLRLAPVAPRLAVVLGSGLQAGAEHIEPIAECPYARLPGFPVPSVSGHAGKAVLALVHGIPALLLCGRVHYYEGWSCEEITFPIRVAAEMGVRTILLTNAAGGIRRGMRPGDLMCVTDHINGMGVNPLRGTRFQPRFVDLTRVYDPALIACLQKAARREKIRLHKGIYMAVSGPSYETPAEIRAFARLGADAVGMSTVPEAIVARQCGLRVAALSCITNLAAGKADHALSHEEVLENGRAAQANVWKLIRHFAADLADGVIVPSGNWSSD